MPTLGDMPLCRGNGDLKRADLANKASLVIFSPLLLQRHLLLRLRVRLLPLLQSAEAELGELEFVKLLLVSSSILLKLREGLLLRSGLISKVEDHGCSDKPQQCQRSMSQCETRWGR